MLALLEYYLSKSMRIWLSLLALLLAANGFFIQESQEVPSEFSWADINGTTFLPPVRNQWFPAPCNSGWAMAATNVLNARIKIRKQAKWPDVQISPQVLLDCDHLDYGCFGVKSLLRKGDPWTAYRWIQQNNITDETCNSYQAKSTGRCVSSTKCMKCK